jgi:hypothetical protein
MLPIVFMSRILSPVTGCLGRRVTPGLPWLGVREYASPL